MLGVELLPHLVQAKVSREAPGAKSRITDSSLWYLASPSLSGPCFLRLEPYALISQSKGHFFMLAYTAKAPAISDTVKASQEGRNFAMLSTLRQNGYSGCKVLVGCGFLCGGGRRRVVEQGCRCEGGVEVLLEWGLG